MSGIPTRRSLRIRQAALRLNSPIVPHQPTGENTHSAANNHNNPRNLPRRVAELQPGAVQDASRSTATDAVNGPGPATAGSALRSNGRIQTVLICVGSGPNGLGLYQKQADFAHFWNLFEMTWSAISGGLSPEMRGFDRPALLALPLVQDTFCTYFEALFSWLTPAEQDNWAKCFEVKWMVTIVQPGGQQASLEECAFLIACGEAVCNERQRAKLGVWPIYTWPTFTCPRMARLGGTQVHWLYQRIGVAQFHQDYFSRLAQF
ncbi:hypothetical protein CcaverHIS631_0511550 [Cutaneotrichosporon cavernicola]|nr:hypothetical protein CcaverHIS631_0511550 [Cutaneotrichosporon cavernicola]